MTTFNEILGQKKMIQNNYLLICEIRVADSSYIIFHYVYVMLKIFKQSNQNSCVHCCL